MRSLGRVYEAVEQERKVFIPYEATTPEDWVRRIAKQAGSAAASVTDPALFEEEMIRLAALAIAAVDEGGKK